MPNLEQSLQGRDLGYFRIVANFWEIEFDAPDARVGLQRLVEKLDDAELLTGVVAALPQTARTALDALLNQEGRMSWALFTRRFGQLREMGIARRDRERPYLDSNANAAESLWYRGLISRAFFDTPNGPEEFAYIPDEFLGHLAGTISVQEETKPPGRPATQNEKGFLVLASDRILDDACTLLAGLRLGLSQAEISRHLIATPVAAYPLTCAALEKILRTTGMIDPNGNLSPDRIRRFLETSRNEALSELFQAWLRSQEFNELSLIPGLATEGEWKNDPLKTRRSILDFLSGVSGYLPGLIFGDMPVYWSLSAFVSAIRNRQPDFQRPSGDYDSWYLRDTQTGEYLRGFETWDRVDGELIRFTLGGPLHWLGILDLGYTDAPADSENPCLASFRFSEMAADLLSLKPPATLAEEGGQLILLSDGRVHVPRMLPRAVRYQIARFTEWEKFSNEVYQYRISSRSLEKARQQGLNVQHLMGLFQRHAKAIPPNLIGALKNWDSRGCEARFEQVMILRVRSPEILQSLQNSKAKRFLGETLGPTTVIVRAGAWEKIALVLSDLGYLSEVHINE